MKFSENDHDITEREMTMFMSPWRLLGHDTPEHGRVYASMDNVAHEWCKVSHFTNSYDELILQILLKFYLTIS